eukprot:snap_masked-scaffold_36-processed-gene-2.55-mRNA-1 protein AED:0.01 eAED:0.01 QI:0/-1/0/1/-1/1/1/0/365
MKVEYQQEKKMLTSPAILSYSEQKRELSFEFFFSTTSLDIKKLAKHSWTGIPSHFRAETWRLLCNYYTKNELSPDNRKQTMKRKRDEYTRNVKLFYEDIGISADSVPKKNSKNDITNFKDFRQILLDLPRTHPGIPLFSHPKVLKSFERILYLWALKHPTCGYVQGMNDVLSPFYLVFLAEKVSAGEVNDILSFDISNLPENLLKEVEADSFICLNYLLEKIEDHYTVEQPGLIAMNITLEETIKRIDHDLYIHFQRLEVDFLQFSFRWFNCLLIRELKLTEIIRLWDTCLSEEDGFKGFYVHIAAALLVTFSPRLQSMDFQDLMVFLQDLPTSSWTEKEIEELLGQAFILHELFKDSPGHLKNR